MIFRITHQNVWMAAEKLTEGQLDLFARLGRLEIFGTGAVALLDALQVTDEDYPLGTLSIFIL